MRDDELVAGIVARDPAALAAAYDWYGGPLYSYCRTLLHEPEDAADAVQQTFVVAATQLSGLWDRSKLRPWLHAVARNECLRRDGTGKALPAQVAGMLTGAETAESWQAALVRDALQGAGAADRDVLSLRLHNLDAGEQALVLGISRRHLGALESRAADQLPACLGALLVARTGREECQDLEAMLDGWDGWLTPKLRRQLTRHLEHCATCMVRRHRELAPSIIDGAALAAVPPGWLRQEVLEAATSADAVAVLARAAAAKRAGPFSRGGFPSRRAQKWRRTHVVRVSAAAAAAVVLAAGGLHFVLPRGPANVAPESASAHVQPGASPGRTGDSGGAGPSAAATGAYGPLATRPAPAVTPSPSPQATTAVAQGTVSIFPSTLTLTPVASSAFTITAHEGPVQWSLRGPASLAGAITASQSVGTLAPGQSVTVTLNEASVLTEGTQLTVSPGGEVITIIAGA